MYLISAYFDDAADKRIQRYIDCVAKRTGNTFMVDNAVPPHITISSFEMNVKYEQQLADILREKFLKINSGDIQCVSVGTFFPFVIYLAFVLNSYLHEMSLDIYDCIMQIDDIKVSPCYRPLCWMPHATVGKKLARDEMVLAFQVLQNQFGPFSGQITKIGLAKTNPYRDLEQITLLSILDKC